MDEKQLTENKENKEDKENKKENMVLYPSSYHSYNKIILHLMVKNESKIIERCLTNAIVYVDAISILDTGSTDNTVNIVNQYIKYSRD